MMFANSECRSALRAIQRHLARSVEQRFAQAEPGQAEAGGRTVEKLGERLLGNPTSISHACWI